MEIAFKRLRDGIPQNQSVLRVNDLSLKDLVRKIRDVEEAETSLTELRKLFKL